jgi:hypothetical protein
MWLIKELSRDKNFRSVMNLWQSYEHYQARTPTQKKKVERKLHGFLPNESFFYSYHQSTFKQSLPRSLQLPTKFGTDQTPSEKWCRSCNISKGLKQVQGRQGNPDIFYIRKGTMDVLQ